MTNKRIFITGIPTAGKSYLAKKLAEKIGGSCVSIDELRRNLSKDPNYNKLVNFYWNQDEYTYYTTTNYDEQWVNLVRQSEGLWPGILKGIIEHSNEDEPVIFEGVNILPHLAYKDLRIPGITIIGNSFDEVRARLKECPRWGKTEKLQELETNAFFFGERPRYKLESEKYGFPVFEKADDAWNKALELLLL